MIHKIIIFWIGIFWSPTELFNLTFIFFKFIFTSKRYFSNKNVNQFLNIFLKWQICLFISFKIFRIKRFYHLFNFLFFFFFRYDKLELRPNTILGIKTSGHQYSSSCSLASGPSDPLSYKAHFRSSTSYRLDNNHRSLPSSPCFSNSSLSKCEKPEAPVRK